MSAQTDRRWLALVLLAAAQFVVVLDASIVNVALPSIGESLSFSQDNLSWVVNAYTLTFGGFLLLGGRLADLLGRRRLFIIGLVLFSAASLLGGLAQSDLWLIAARAFDATGAVLVTGGLALLVYTLVDAESAGWTSTQTLGLGALSLATLAAFVAWESRATDPLMPFSIFRLQTLRGAKAVGLLLGMSLIAMFFFISLYMQQVLGYSALEAGFAFLPLAGTIMISATVA